MHSIADCPRYKMKVLFNPNGSKFGRYEYLSFSPHRYHERKIRCYLTLAFQQKRTFILINQKEDLLKRENVVAKLTPNNDIPGTFSRAKRA